MKRLLLSLVLILCLGSISTYNVYADSLGAAIFLGGAGSAMGAGEAVGAAVASSALLPYVIVALGVAGLGYVAYDTGLLSSALNALKSAGSYVFDIGGQGVDYIYTVVKDGKNYISKSIIDIIANWGLEYGLFDGVQVEGSEVILPDNDNIPQSYRQYLSNFNGVININRDFAKYFYNYSFYRNGIMFQKTSNIINDSVYGTVISSGNSVCILMCSADNFACESGNISSITETPGIMNVRGVTNTTLAGGTIAYYTSTESGGIDNRDYLKSIPGVNINDSADINVGAVIWGILNGYVSDLGSGIPITDNIPDIVDNDITLPNWNTESIEVEGELYYPVSLPKDYDIPVYYPIGEDSLISELPEGMIIDDDYVWDDGLNTNPGLPDENAQEDAQTGSIGIFPGVESIPSSWLSDFVLKSEILDRFPFCIPSDMVRTISIMRGDGSREAPVYVWHYNLAGRTGEVVIDLSMYNSVAAIMRNGELILFILGLGFATKEIIKF